MMRSPSPTQSVILKDAISCVKPTPLDSENLCCSGPSDAAELEGDTEEEKRRREDDHCDRTDSYSHDDILKYRVYALLT